MRLALPLLVALALGCGGHANAASSSKTAAQEAPLKLVYQRSGGFAGFLDRLVISGDSLTLTRRNKLTFERKLTAEEQESLARLAKDALAAPAPGKLGAPGADTFELNVTVGDGQPQLTSYGHNLEPVGAAPAWQALTAKLRSLFDDAMHGK